LISYKDFLKKKEKGLHFHKENLIKPLLGRLRDEEVISSDDESNIWLVEKHKGFVVTVRYDREEGSWECEAYTETPGTNMLFVSGKHKTMQSAAAFIYRQIDCFRRIKSNDNNLILKTT